MLRKCRAVPCDATCTQTILPTLTTFHESCTAAMEAGIDGQAASGGTAGQGPACDTTALYGIMLECNTWTTAAMADGVITLDDGFCTSTCHDHASEVTGCSGHMTTEMTVTFRPLVQLVHSCQTTNPTIRCNMNQVQQRCGADVAAASAACTHSCVNALDSERLLCAQDPTYLAYAVIKAACADATEIEQCADTAAVYLAMTNSVCCVDQDCTDLPAECTPECAATFMPFFSRCGMQTFGTDPTQLSKFQGFERKCAIAVGREVDLAAALGGPDPGDPCSANTDCNSCMGSCGWCRDEIAAGGGDQGQAALSCVEDPYGIIGGQTCAGTLNAVISFGSDCNSPMTDLSMLFRLVGIDIPADKMGLSFAEICPVACDACPSADHTVRKQNRGGWCASECVTTEGECNTAEGHR
jgi:hypothetical protein